MEFSKWRQNALLAIMCIFIIDLSFIFVAAYSSHNFTEGQMAFLAAGQAAMAGVALLFAKMGKGS